MTDNLVSLASIYLTSDLKDKIAGALGTDRRHVRQATSAAIPAILGGLVSLASSREGVQRIDAALAQHSPSVLDNISASISGERRRDFVDKGTNSLSSLLGSSSVPALGNAVARFSGLAQSKGSSLIAMLTPMVLALIGKEKVEQGLDESGLARLLIDQKDNISAAMPSQFKRLLRSPNMPAIAGIGRPGEPAGVPSAFAGTRRAGRSPSRTWWLWVLIVIGVIGVALWFFSSPTTQVPDRKQTVIGGVELSSTLRTTLGGLTTALNGIDDVTSARAALPELEIAEAELEGILELSRQLPPEGRKALTSVVVNVRPEIERAARVALSVPGVDSVIEPKINALRTRLDRLANL